MSLFGKLMVFMALCVMFVFGVGGALTVISFKPVAEPVHKTIGYMPTFSIFLVFVLLAWLPFSVLLLSFRKKAVRGLTALQTKDGIINITDTAIVKCIRNALRQIPDVVQVQTTVKNTSRGMVAKVRAQVRITAGSLLELNRLMRESVLDTLTRVLGIDNVADVKIIIEDIKVSGETTPPMSGTIPPDITLESQV